MASDVSIANRALTKLGADRILLLTDETQAARTINSMYTDVRDAEIRRYTWKFSIKRTSLSALATAPEWGFDFQYPLPFDYLGLVQVNEYYVRSLTDKNAAWSVEGGNILTNFEAPLKLRYKARIENPAMFDPLFVEVLACKLALEACETLTQSGSKYDAAAQGYKFALAEAARQDAIENPPDELPWGSWLDSREAD
jgi:hypothetical protein